MKLGVVGCGVVGGALAAYLKKVGHEVVLDDPPRGINGDCGDAEALFICVPVPTITDKRGRILQDTSVLKSVLQRYNGSFKNKPIYIRSTILPKTADHFYKFMKLRVYAMPEFLTEREANKTFTEQEIICGVENDPNLRREQEDILDKIFPDKKIILMENREAELAKYAHNVMASLKVNFFNLIYRYSQKIRANYTNVLEGALMSGYINLPHTMVPGPDGKFGFGGKCFPKDTAAFIGECERIGLQMGSLKCAMFENYMYRARPGEDLPLPKITYEEKGKQLALLFNE